MVFCDWTFVGECRGSCPRTQEMKEAITLKESYEAWSACGIPEAPDRYQQNQQRATVIVAYTKTQVWEVLRETAEQDFRLALKLFKRHTIYSGDRTLLTSTKDMAKQWKEHFEDLLNPTFTSAMQTESGHTVCDSPITEGEVTNVVKPLLSGRAPGMNEMGAEFLKAVKVEGLSWLTCLCNIAWRSGSVGLLAYCDQVSQGLVLE